MRPERNIDGRAAIPTYGLLLLIPGGRARPRWRYDPRLTPHKMRS
jgi:hypothetical protein